MSNDFDSSWNFSYFLKENASKMMEINDNDTQCNQTNIELNIIYKLTLYNFLLFDNSKESHLYL